MTAPAASLEEPMATHHFVLVAEGVDLLEWETLDALYRGGCGDATVGRHTLEFDGAATDASRSVVLGFARRRVGAGRAGASHRVRHCEHRPTGAVSALLSSGINLRWRRGGPGLGGWCFSEGFGLAGAVELHGCHWVSRGGSCGDGGCGAVSG